MSRAPLLAFAGALALLGLAAPACDDELVDPVLVDSATATPALTHPPSQPLPPKRTVTTRNPFGNVGASENLLWDGDFEWSSPFTDQYGWIELPANPTVSDVVIGAACKSGVKCIRLKKNKIALGIAVSSTRPFLQASVWVRFEDAADQAPTACAKADVRLLDAGGLEPSDPDFELAPVEAAPSAEGWCQLTGTSPLRKNKTYLYVQNRSATTMLVDDAVLLAVDTAPSPSPSPAPPPVPSKPSSAEDAAFLAAAREAIRATRLPQDGRPNPARDAFEARMRSK
jgi:hypothetical protein